MGNGFAFLFFFLGAGDCLGIIGLGFFFFSVLCGCRESIRK